MHNATIHEQRHQVGLMRILATAQLRITAITDVSQLSIDYALDRRVYCSNPMS